MSRPKGSKNARKPDPIFPPSNEECIGLLANLIVDIVWEEQARLKTNDATMKAMSLSSIPIPADDKSNTAGLLRKMDTDAKDQGKSGWLELMIEQSPDMAEIFQRMVKSEIEAKTAGHKMPGCDVCEVNT